MQQPGSRQAFVPFGKPVHVVYQRPQRVQVKGKWSQIPISTCRALGCPKSRDRCFPPWLKDDVINLQGPQNPLSN